MVKGILALLTAALVALPIVWQWSKARATKKAEKEHTKAKQDIRKAVTSGDIDSVKRTMARWL